jgi:hypothetical protein
MLGAAASPPAMMRLREGIQDVPVVSGCGPWLLGRLTGLQGVAGVAFDEDRDVAADGVTVEVVVSRAHSGGHILSGVGALPLGDQPVGPIVWSA